MLTRCLLQVGTELQIVGVIYSLSRPPRDLQMFMLAIALTIMERVASTLPCDTRNRHSGECMSQKVASHHKEMYTTKLVASIWGQFLSLGDNTKSCSNSFKGLLLINCAKISRF